MLCSAFLQGNRHGQVTCHKCSLVLVEFGFQLYVARFLLISFQFIPIQGVTVLVISNLPRALHSLNFEITHALLPELG